MPRLVRETVYCYCSPPRYLLRVKYTWAERQRMFWREVVEFGSEVADLLTAPAKGVFNWLWQPAAGIQMVERKEPEPMCQHSWELDELPATRVERLMKAEAVREHHRALSKAANESAAGRQAFYAHKQLHHDAAQRLRAERTK
jgi:hypothetical protein